MELGQTIVQQLNLESRGTVLERWLAHHLAEVMSAITTLGGQEKALAEQRAVDLILKLWLHRRALPEPVDPLGGFRDSIAVLSRLLPEANPWARFSRGRSYESLLQELFETMRQVVLGGVLLTQVRTTRPVLSGEADLLEPQEIYMAETLRGWMALLSSPLDLPELEVSYGDPEAENNPSNSDSPADREEATQVKQAVQRERDAHRAIAVNLERMHTELGRLLVRWNNSLPSDHESDDELPDGLPDDAT